MELALLESTLVMTIFLSSSLDLIISSVIGNETIKVGDSLKARRDFNEEERMWSSGLASNENFLDLAFLPTSSWGLREKVLRGHLVTM